MTISLTTTGGRGLTEYSLTIEKWKWLSRNLASITLIEVTSFSTL